MIDEQDALGRLRNVLFGVAAAGFAGTALDLALLAHYEDPLQFAPFVIVGVSLIAIAGHAVSRSRVSLRLMRLAMAVAIAGAATGVALHYRGSMEFQLEVNPSLGGLDLLALVMTSKAPPTMAPMNLAILGLVGLASTYREARSVRL